MNNYLHEACRRQGLVMDHVAEVGVYHPETSNVLGFIRDGTRTMLVEPDPDSLARIRDYFRGYDTVSIMPYAIWDEAGHVSLYRTNSSTFVSSLDASPALVNDGYVPDERDSFRAEARLFSDIDDGTIDLLSIDVEGAEWYVLKHMRSRPKVISLETHAAEYRNPFMAMIARWMREHGYQRWFVHGSDTVYIRADAVTLSLPERLRRGISNNVVLARHRFKAMKRRIKYLFLLRRSRGQSPE
ncbi:MAG: FkbM family methyltransferase [Gammaproteobacteria bacterium]|jgi:FkbM family methyltransferase|nr:FkbM family methyltransferase [Gammaproteobacteria bacterium]